MRARNLSWEEMEGGEVSARCLLQKSEKWLSVMGEGSKCSVPHGLGLTERIVPDEIHWGNLTEHPSGR